MAGEEISDNFDLSQKNEINFIDQEKEWLVQADDNYNKKKYDGKPRITCKY